MLKYRWFRMFVAVFAAVLISQKYGFWWGLVVAVSSGIGLIWLADRLYPEIREREDRPH